ncbi:MAG TPA: phosphoribosyl-ATP diphosphatase [Azospirillum sp.]|nr:phosphoribosyl-ATP diphosphatase [Azospirillum sp.]
MVHYIGIDVLRSLHEGIIERRNGDAKTSRTAKLFAQGSSKVASKVGEEAVEVVIEAMRADKHGVVMESADLLYHLVALWVDLGIKPDVVWAELRRREMTYGIAEKLPKDDGPLPRVSRPAERRPKKVRKAK